ncbi:kinase-like domain-containing protein [Flagelloscypha sp. PMI_526]|nr:kinase-like domain-containing protein [Flagelloscypha sp. PMI_526]
MASQFYDPTQPTQVDDDIVDLPNSNVDLADSFWGYLQPCSQAHKRFSFALDQPDQTVGRNKHNTVRLENAKISNFHAQIKWDGGMGHEGMVTLKDISTNGTFINGERISKHSHYVLRDGSEIGFGTTSVQCAIPKDDFRFIYRFTAASAKAITVHKFYELANELGKGTFATVMKAVKRATGEPVAIKMIHKQLRKKLQREGDSTIGGSSPDDSDPTSVAFRREIEVMEKMDHPNICGLRETFWDDGGGPKSSYQCYLVLELVPGGDLLDYISRYEGLDDLESKQITFQMCRALEYIHLQEIAHRDLKPENVLLTNDQPPIVKIADFGLAKALDSMTMLKTMCGTPSYLAPEVVSQHRTGEGYDLVVDSWSLGVIVFSMLTNSSPFIENSELDIKSRIEQRSIDWETLRQSPASKQASDFIRRLLEPDPARRLQLIHSLAEPWFKKYVPPAHHIIPDNYWQDDHRPGPIIRNPETGEEIPRTQVLKPPPTHSATQARPSSGPSIIGLSQLKVGSMKDVDDEEEEDEALRNHLFDGRSTSGRWKRIRRC